MYGLFTFAHALAPERSPDGTAYHLGVVGRYFRNGGFDWYTTNFYANLPMGMEMLFLFAYAFGRHSAAALIHWQFLIVLPWLILNCGRRFHVPAAGAIAALLVFMSPVVGIDGSSAYVDIAMAAAAFAMFHALLVWEMSGSTLSVNGWLIAAGVLAGWVYACKMTGFPATLLAVGFVAVTLLRARRFALRPLITVGLCSVLVIAPWLVKNALTVGNPFSPFLNRVFPNPYVTVHFEDEYRKSHRDYYGTIKSVSEIPAEVTVRGGKLNGLLGPVFLLAPLGSIALRWPSRQTRTRRSCRAPDFVPDQHRHSFSDHRAAVRVTCNGGIVRRRIRRGTGTAVVLFHAFFGWPSVLATFVQPGAWSLDVFRWKPALRIEQETAFLSRIVPFYDMARLVETHVPPDGRVLTFGTVAEAYTSREILMIYEAALNGIAGETLGAGASTAYHPQVVWEYKFAPRKARRIRLVQTNSAPEPWNVNELRAYSFGSEVGREAVARVSANPFPWTVQFAFDNNPLTRWRTWEPAAPEQWIQLDFGREVEVDLVRTEVSLDQRTAARLEVQTSPGRWETAAAQAEGPDPAADREFEAGRLCLTETIGRHAHSPRQYRRSRRRTCTEIRKPGPLRCWARPRGVASIA